MTRLLLATFAFLVIAAPAYAVNDVRISTFPYVRHDGATGTAADITIQSCSSTATDPAADAPTPTPAADEGAARKQQNEPAAAVDPNAVNHMTAGSNDYCPTVTTGDSWAGFYYSNNGGEDWTASLLPGYPTDTSTEGRQSPLYRFVTSAGDPVQAWDRWGHLYYGGIAFNRTRPANGSIWMARYDWPMLRTAPDYEFTTLVSRGTPSPIFRGHFEDKVQLEVDRGVASPYSGNSSRPFGNVYMCWARFTAGANNFVYFARSTDGGRTFDIQKVSEGVHGVQFCDIAVTKTGIVFVAFRQFEWKGEQGQRQRDAVAWVKSTDGGRSFTKPAVAREFIHWDLVDRYGSAEAAGNALYEACLAGDGRPGACSSPEPRFHARDCGDGPFVCQSGYVFHRMASQVRITADPTAAGDPDAAYVVYDATVPGTQTPTGTSFGTVTFGVGSQGSIYFIKTNNGGATWTVQKRIDPIAKGHQFFPDIDANAGRLHAVYHDSRFDCASGPPSTPSGGDYRTVPISNKWVSANPPGSVACGPGLDTFYALSTNDGATWSSTRASEESQMPQYEMFGNRDVPFHGDYNYISAVGSTVLMDWTDTRDVVPGTDPRYDVAGTAPDDGTDGFDVFQCRVAVSGGFSADRCPNAGGLDQNIYGTIFPQP